MEDTSNDPPPPTCTTRSGRTRRQRTIFSPDTSPNRPAQAHQPSTTEEVPVVLAPPKRTQKRPSMKRVVVEELEQKVASEKDIEDEVESSEDGEDESSEEGGG